MGNPTGKHGPRLKERLEAKAVELIRGDSARNLTHADVWIEALNQLAISGDLGAIREIFDRLEGKAVQKIESDVGGRLEVIVRHVDGMGLDLSDSSGDIDEG